MSHPTFTPPATLATTATGTVVPACRVPLPAGDETPTADRHPALVYLRTLQTDTSRETMRRSLDTLAAILTDGRADHISLPWHRLRYEHTSALAAILARRYAPDTANKHLSALRQTIDTAWQLGWIDADARDRATRIKRIRGSRPQGAEAGRSLSGGEIRALFDDAHHDGTLGARDAALLALLYGAGLRRTEAVQLDLSDYDGGHDHPRVTVHGKRNKTRPVYLGDGADAAVADWVAVRGPEPGPLLLPVLKSGRTADDRRLSAAGVYQALRVRAGRAGVREFTPHDLRRSYVGDLLDAGEDVSTVSGLTGHDSVDTTARYDRRGDRAKQRAAEAIHVPYIRRDGNSHR